MVELRKDSPAKVPLSSDSPSKAVKQPRVVEKEANTTKGVAPYATKPPIVLQDPIKEKEVPLKMEIILATLPVPTKGDFKGKGLVVSEAALT